MFRQKGRFSNSLTVLVDVWMPVYAVQRESRVVLVDAVITCLYPKLKRELEDYSFKPSLLLLTHSHFDHIGVAGYLKRDFPEMRIGASPVAAGVLQKEKALKLISTLEDEAARLAGEEPLPFIPFNVDLLLKEGQAIDGIKVLETPGHTRCSLSYFFPEEKLLFVGDALGVVEEDGYIRPQFLSDYRAYLASIEKISSLLPLNIVMGHGGIIPEEESEDFLKKIKERTEEFASQILELYRKEGDPEKVFDIIFQEEYVGRKLNQPEQSYSINLRAMIKAVLKAEGIAL